MDSSGRGAAYKWLLGGALLAGLLARAPGIYWGHNFPSNSGFAVHHPDEWTHVVLAEPLIAPWDGSRWVPTYPKGLAAMTAVPMVAGRLISGNLRAPRPLVRETLTVGRSIVALLGVCTILIVFLLGRRITGDVRVGLAGAWFLALGGLHVSQSHFFVADVPAIFLTMLGLLLLLVDLDNQEGGHEALRWAALAFGMAFGMKIFVAGLPSLALVAVLRTQRIRRIAHVAIFFLAGFVIVNLGMFTPLDLLASLRSGVNDPYVYNRAMGLLLYAIESPAVFGLPLLGFAFAGSVMAVRRLVGNPRDPRRLRIAAVLGLPVLVHGLLVAFNLDLFPRHLVVFIPFAALAAGYALVGTLAVPALARRRTLVLLATFGWLAFFVFDGERNYVTDPRNDAYRWLQANVPEGTNIWWYYHDFAVYPQLVFPDAGRAPVLVVEMMQANHILSGVGFRNSYPRDRRNVFDNPSQQQVDDVQALFRGDTEYAETARFREGYFMPEFLWSERWLGNRSRNYLTEVVIFKRDAGT